MSIKPPPRVFYPLRLDPDDLAALRRIEDEVGIPRAEQCRRAIKAWLRDHGIRKNSKAKNNRNGR